MATEDLFAKMTSQAHAAWGPNRPKSPRKNICADNKSALRCLSQLSKLHTACQIWHVMSTEKYGFPPRAHVTYSVHNNVNILFCSSHDGEHTPLNSDEMAHVPLNSGSRRTHPGRLNSQHTQRGTFNHHLDHLHGSAKNQ